MDYFEVALKFRNAIEKARSEQRFTNRGDRMRYFPRGCCDDSCDLLAHYLLIKYGIETKQGIGAYKADIPELKTWHAWLILPDQNIIDITIDQFPKAKIGQNGVYYGPPTQFYLDLTDVTTYENIDISTHNNLGKDYEIIIEYLKD